MSVQGRGGNSVDDLEGSCISKELSGCGEEFGVQRVELIWVGICPQGESINAPNDVKCAGESVDDVISGEAITSPRYPGNGWIRLIGEVT